MNGELATAVRASGELTCVTLLREAGVWAGDDRRIHVQVAPNSGTALVPGVRFHWQRSRFGGESLGRVSRQQALWQAMNCLDNAHAVAAMESALHKGYLTRDEVRRLELHAPRRLEWGIRRMIANSGSGNETIVRLRLLRAGFSVVTQGEVPGLGRQDLVVEDCVGLEIDSTEWHPPEAGLTDTTRDLHSAGLGRPVLRIRPEHIYRSWDHTLAVIERVVSDALRLRR